MGKLSWIAGTRPCGREAGSCNLLTYLQLIAFSKVLTKFATTQEGFPSRVQDVPVDGEDKLEVEIFPFGDVLEKFVL